MNIPWKTIGATITKNAPSILTGIGVGGFVTATVMAVKATPKYQEERKIYNCDYMIGKDGEKTYAPRETPLEFKDEAIIVAKHFWPEAIIIAGSMACVLFANKLNLQRQAALAAACSISETALKNYKNKAIEVLGPKEEQKQIANKVKEDIVDSRKEEILANKGLYPMDVIPMIDEYSGTMFYLSPEDVRQASRRFNQLLSVSERLPYGDLWDELCELAANRDRVSKPKAIESVYYEYDNEMQDEIAPDIYYVERNGYPVGIITFCPRPEVDIIGDHRTRKRRI